MLYIVVGLKNALKTQSVALEATKSLIENLRNELADKENDCQRMTELWRAAEQERNNDLQVSSTRKVDLHYYRLSLLKMEKCSAAGIEDQLRRVEEIV